MLQLVTVGSYGSIRTRSLLAATFTSIHARNVNTKLTIVTIDEIILHEKTILIGQYLAIRVNL